MAWSMARALGLAAEDPDFKAERGRRNSLLINCAISFLGLLAVFVLLVIFSGKIVQPVSESCEKQKQFISVAGHEIKTPVTIIDAEILAMEIGDDNEWLGNYRRRDRV